MIGWQQAHEHFSSVFASEPELLCCAPGRVNLIGEHIDYAGGEVLPLSINLGISVAIRPTQQGLLRISAAQSGHSGIITLDGSRSSQPDGTLAYIAELAACTGQHSAELAILSDLPIGQGLSSSAALGIALQCALLAMSPDAVMPSAGAVCRAAQRSEHVALGTSCGLMDQYASMFGRADSAVLIDTWKESYRHVRLDAMRTVRIIVVDSGQPRELSASLYNQRHAEMSGALAELKRRSGGFDCFRQRGHAELLEIANLLPEPASRRLRHLLMEQRRVGRYCDALREEDMKLMGRILYAGHRSLSTDAQVSTPQIDCLVELLQELPHCLGARLMGGGFGGSVLALMDAAPDAAQLDALLREYRAETTLTGSWTQLHPGDGAWLQSGPDSRRSVAEWLS